MVANELIIMFNNEHILINMSRTFSAALIQWFIAILVLVLWSEVTTTPHSNIPDGNV